MAVDIKKLFALIKEHITTLTTIFPGQEYLIKSELCSLNEFIADVYKSLVVKPPAVRQPRTSNTRRKTIDATYRGRNTVKGKGINDFNGESQEQNLEGGGAKIKDDAPTENSRRDKRKRQGEPEKSLAIEECVGDQHSVALPRLGISASGLPKEHGSSSNPITLSDSSPDKPQVTIWDSQSETLIYNWSRQTNLPELLEIANRLPDGVLFHLPRMEKSSLIRLNKAEIVQMFTELQSRAKLSSDLINYFLSRLKPKYGVQIEPPFNVQILDSYWDSPKQADLSKPAAELNLVP